MNDKWILPFQYHSNFNYENNKISFPDRLEKAYTKGDLLDYFGYYSNENIITSPQYWAGCFFIKKTDKSINFLNEWLEVFDKNFDLIDDSFSKIENYSEFNPPSNLYSNIFSFFWVLSITDNFIPLFKKANSLILFWII